MKLQNARDSVIYWIGFASAVCEALLGVLLVSGCVTAEMAGSIMTGFAVILGWCNGNNPNIAGQYAPAPSRKRAETDDDSDDEPDDDEEED